jgi:amino acid transporter/nucleotide-binding universal stress UspA family protein
MSVTSSLGPDPPERQRPARLKRLLGLWGGVELGVAAMIGGSIFTLTGFVAATTGPSLPIAFLLTALLAALPTVLVYAELASTRPEAGGGYSWIREALGPVHGHFAGWFSWCAHSVACAVYATSFGFYFTRLLEALVLPFFGLSLPGATGLWRVVFALIAILVLSSVNYRGVRLTGLIGRAAILVGIGILLVFAGVAISAIFTTPPKPQPLGDWMPFGFGGVLAGMGLVFLAFQGFEVVSQAGEEMKEPRRNMPRALFISFGFVLVLYLLVVTSAMLGVKADIPGWQVLADAGEGALVAAAAHLPLSRVMVDLLTFGGAAVALAALNATIFSASHVFYAMAHLGRSLPVEFETLHPKYGTPMFGILASAVLMVVLATVLPIKDIAAIADLLFFFIFAQVHVAYIQYRRKFPSRRRPFTAPFYPWLSIATLCVFVVLAIEVVHISPWALSFFLGWLILGILIQRVYIERHESGEFARHKIVEFGEMVNQSSGYLVLLPVIYQTSEWRGALPLAAALANRNRGELFVLAIVRGPSSGSQDLILGEQKQKALDFHSQILKEVSGLGVTYTARAHLGSSVADTVLQAVEKLDANLLLMPYEHVPNDGRDRPPSEGGIARRDFTRVLRESRCDLLIYNTIPHRWPKRLLVLVAKSSHNRLLGRVAWSLAWESGAETTLLHVAGDDGAEEEQVWNQLLEELGPPPKDFVVHKRWINGNDVVGGILESSLGFDLVLMGAKSTSTFAPVVLGPTASAILERSQTPVFICHTHTVLPMFIAAERLLGEMMNRIRRIQRNVRP